MSSKRFTIVLGLLLVLVVSYIAFADVVSIRQDLQKQDQTIQHLDTEKTKLNEELDETNQIKEQTEEDFRKLEKHNQDLENERQRLEQELQAKRETQNRLAQASSQVVNAVTFTETASAQSSTGGCGDNEYAAYIYGQESGGRVTGKCDPAAVNWLGCTGIGQACPSSKIAHCGTDYACQNAWFTNYAIERYGSWANAYAFHKANNWW